MHCLPADITGVSCAQGEVAKEVFEKYRLATYREAGYKPFVIAALMFLTRLQDPAGALRRLSERALSGRSEEIHMSSIVTQVNESVRRATAARCRERGIVIPTFAQLRDPDLIPASHRERLQGVGLWDVNPANLFRITWKNDVATGLYGKVNWIEIPREITGIRPRLIGLMGKYFPTGAHKVGAAFGCLVPRLVSGSLIPGGTRRYGLRPATTAGAGRSIARCWIARPSRYCPRRCRRSGSPGCARSERR